MIGKGWEKKTKSLNGPPFIHLFVLSFVDSTETNTVFSCPGLLQPDGAGPEPVDFEEDQDFEEYGTFENEDQAEEEPKDDTT